MFFLASSVVFAAIVLNQDVNVTVNVASSGGGGDTVAHIYQDQGCTTVLTDLTFNYTQSGSRTLRAYIKDSEGLTSVQILPDTIFNALTFSNEIGLSNGTSKPLDITVQGGGVGTFSGTVNFHN